MNNFIDAFLHKYPFETLHEMNLDWLISAVKELAAEVNNFEIVNQFTYEGSWDITKQYKKYGIVTVNNTEGYLSLQPVPAGVDITNSDYWVMIADYTAVIAGLGLRVTALEKKFDKWNDRTVVFLGDSYMTGWHADGTANPTYVDIIASNLQMGSYYNQSVGGVGFSTGRPYSYLDMFNNFRTAHPTVTPTDIMMIGGYNDNSESAADCKANAATTITAIRSSFPDVNIYIGYIGRGAGANTARSYIDNINAMAACYMEIAMLNDCNYIKHSEIALHNYKGLSSDGIHPNQTGHNAIGKYLSLSLTDGYFKFNEEYAAWEPLVIDHTLPTGSNKLAPLPGSTIWYQKLTKNGVIIQGRTGLVSFGSNPITGVDLSGSSIANSLCLGKISGNSNCRNFFSTFGSTNQICIPVGITLLADVGGGNETFRCPGNILINDNGGIYLKCTYISDAFNYLTNAQIAAYVIDSFEYTIPLDLC